MSRSDGTAEAIPLEAREPFAPRTRGGRWSLAGKLKYAVAKKRAAGRRIAQWFVPATSAGLAFRDFVLRASSWPALAPFVRRSLAAESLFGS